MLTVSGFLLLVAATPVVKQAPATPPLPVASRTQSFKTDIAPRVDPVFGDALELRATIDLFLLLQEQMADVRARFSVSVNGTLAAIPKPTRGRKPPCPDSIDDSYRNAHNAGADFLILGRRMREIYREIERADELEDTIGLTPHHRFKAKRAQGLYRDLLNDYRDMRVAFHDQLNAELRHAGCDVRSPPRTNLPAALVTATDEDQELDPENPRAWDPTPPSASGTNPRAAGPSDNGETISADLQNHAAQSIWIEIDNRACNEVSRLAIDGITVGDLPASRQTSVRAHAGTRSLCLLPASDGRICGQPGTLRSTYLYEGLTLRVHCGT